MHYTRQKPFPFLILLLSIQVCYGVGEDVALNSVKCGAEALKECTQKLVIATKEFAGAIDAGGKQLAGITMQAADAAKNVAEVTAETAKHVTHIVAPVAYAGVAIAATYVTYRIGAGIYDRYNNWRNKKTIIVANQVLVTAKQALLDAIIKNSHNKEGLFGFPEGCEKEVGNLLALPGGNDELEKIRGNLSRH